MSDQRPDVRAVSCLLAIAPLVCPFAHAGDGDDGDGYAAQEAMVRLVAGTDIDELNAQYGTVVLAEMPDHRLFLLGLPGGWTEDQFEVLLDADDRVEEAALNHFSDAPEGQTQSFFVHVPESGWQGSYAWPRIRLEQAHPITRGGGVVVAVLDTGVDAAHPLLAGRLLADAYDFVANAPGAADVGNGLDDDGDGLVDELVGHGTFLAGVIATVAPDAMILPVRVLEGDGASRAFHVAQGIFFAVDHGADVINLSLGTTEDNEMLEIALEYARDHDVVVVAATGNEGQQQPLYPAVDDDTIAVAATDADDLLAPFSNYGEHVSISAPGDSIASSVPDVGFGEWSGTSMATALVSGTAALVRSAAPQLGRDQIIDALLGGAAAIDEANPGYVGLIGAGRLDAAAAVMAVAAPREGDLDGNGTVGVEDLLTVIMGWGECPSEGPCAGDADGSGTVDVEDLLIVLLNWG